MASVRVLGFTQECTAPYMAAVRARYGGRWICGLCGDTVGEELGRVDPLISPRKVLNRHTAVCRTRCTTVSPSPEENAGDLIAAVRKLLLRRLGLASSPLRALPKRVRSTPSSPQRSGAVSASASARVALARTRSCLAALLK
ncbi:hypothetical protein E2562_032952 [Oryza meyeriana var. granulata]|uniref:Uncharacterized protein n=1 Tax=Oryza meyeriana var. granulata TaxID=110450 RepID=A0A6G1DA13_9ORYZ|nr:hypothetical protein E2562_032952 [Oryza meyeriana var. granulata]